MNKKNIELFSRASIATNTIAGTYTVPMVTSTIWNDGIRRNYFPLDGRTKVSLDVSLTTLRGTGIKLRTEYSADGTIFGRETYETTSGTTITVGMADRLISSSGVKHISMKDINTEFMRLSLIALTSICTVSINAVISE